MIGKHTAIPQGIYEEDQFGVRERKASVEEQILRGAGCVGDQVA